MSSYYIIICLRHFCRAAVSFNISNLLICFCSFYFFCPILEKDNFIEHLYIVLSFIILFVSVHKIKIGLYLEGRKCLFNTALGTLYLWLFYLWLYSVGHMVKLNYQC